MKKKKLLLFIIVLPYVSLFAQNTSTLTLTPGQFEALFLKQNLQLIAEQMNISVADAAVIQARLWDNPELSITSVNLWSTDKQRDGEDEFIPPFLGGIGKNTQFSIELSQLIQTANKRGKLVRKEKIARDIAKEEFEDVLRGLKIELRKSIYEVCYLQSFVKVLCQQQESLEQLIQTYRKSVTEGNIARSELMRLQSSLLEKESAILETQTLINEYQKTLKALINADPLVKLEFKKDIYEPVHPDNISLNTLLSQGLDFRPDVKRQLLTTQYYEKSLAYERSLRVPDLTIHANYDRAGGVWKDFIGFGISIDLPFFNRNQGNIKTAKFMMEQSHYLAEQTKKNVQNELVEAYDNYSQAYEFYKKNHSDDFLQELDPMLEVYSKNLLNRNVSMLEYIDFMETYTTNKQIILTSEKNVNVQFEELQYLTGTEIK